MSKKGDLNYFNAAVIGIAVLIALFFFTNILVSFFGEYGKIGACQATILKANILKEGLFGALSNSLKCNDLPDTIIKANSVSKNGRLDSSADNLVKKTLADSMLRCWSMVGKGQVDPYKKYDGDQVYCFICSDVIFDKDFVTLANSQNYKATDMIYWLATNNVPDLKTTYFEALYGVKPDTKVVSSFKGQEFPLDINQQYVILWRMDAHKGGIGTLTGIGLGGLSGAVLGAKIGLLGGPVGVITLAAGVGTIGLVGSYWVSENFDPKIPRSTSIFLVPKTYLGYGNLTLEKSGIKVEKPFCTTLVNS